jgi:hypothetical protein
MKNKRRRRTPTKTVLTAVARVAIGLVLHRPHCALLSAGFACRNELTLFGTTAPTLAIYHSFSEPQNLQTPSRSIAQRHQCQYYHLFLYLANIDLAI